MSLDSLIGLAYTHLEQLEFIWIHLDNLGLAYLGLLHLNLNGNIWSQTHNLMLQRPFLSAEGAACNFLFSIILHVIEYYFDVKYPLR